MAEKKRISGLGRGLSALLEESPVEAATVSKLALADIVANPTQPRRHFDPEALAELVASIRQHGVLQPILVRPANGGRFEIIAGERRWRAAQAAGLHEIPAVVRSLDDRPAYEIALIENIQRSDLSAIEEALGYVRLVKEFGHTQQALAEIVGKSRSHVANLLRLLDLPEPVQAMVNDGRLSMGHARALLGADDPATLAERIIAGGLSVRATEQLVARTATTPPARRNRPARPAAAGGDANSEALELQLSESIGMPVAVAVGPGQGSGSLTIRFDSLDQLDWLCGRLSG